MVGLNENNKGHTRIDLGIYYVSTAATKNIELLPDTKLQGGRIEVVLHKIEVAARAH